MTRIEFCQVFKKTVKNIRIAVVNKKDGKKIDLERIIKKEGFAEDSPNNLVFFTLDEIEKETYNVNNFELLLIDNSDEKLSEEEISKIIENFSGKVRLVCFTKSDLSNYSQLSRKAKIVKMEERLGDALLAALS